MTKYHKKWKTSFLIFLLLIGIISPTVSAGVNTFVENVQLFLDQILVDKNSGLVIQFDLSTDGALDQANGDLIKLQFPNEFTIPATISTNDIKVNGVAIALGDVTVTNNTFDLPLPALSTYGNSTSITIEIPDTVGINTPNVAGDYSVTVSTTQDPISAVSNLVTITSIVTEPLVSVYSNHIKKYALYEIVFRTANTPASFLDGNNGDTISITFPIGTSLPVTIDNSLVTINGEKLGTDVAAIQIDQANRIITLPLPKNVYITQDSFVQVEIDQSALIQNPATSGNYTLQVSTIKDTSWKDSVSYSILDSIITVPELTVFPNIVNTAGSYYIQFNVSSEGILTGGTDEVYLRFDNNVTLPASIAKSYIKINEQVLTNDPVINGQLLTLTVPDGQLVGAGQEVKVWISQDVNILHPVNKGSYFVTINTSQDTVENNSNFYEIEEAIQKVKVLVSPDTAGQIGQYIIGMTNGNIDLLGANDDTVTIQFPEGTTLPSSISYTTVYVNGVTIEQASDIVVDPTERTVTLTIPSIIIIPANSYINFLFTPQAGIQNPKVIGDYYLYMKSSQEIAYQVSEPYEIQGNQIRDLNVQFLENGIGLYSEISMTFKVSDQGGLVGGQDTITLMFPQEMTLPSSLNRTTIQVNKISLDQDVVLSPTNRTLKLTLPSQMFISKNGSVQIDLSPSAYIKNPSQVGSYSLSVYTSRDTVAVQSNVYTIGKQISSPTVSLSPNNYQAAGQYVIGFYTSDQGDLSESISDYVEILFPNGTIVPTSISTSNVLINGKPAKTIQVSGQSVKMYIPAGVNISAGKYVGIVIKTGANIKNPAGNNYSLKARTSKDMSYVSSESYSTVGASNNNSSSSTPAQSGQVALKLSSHSVSSLSEYEISYKTSSSGTLYGGIDEITLIFSSKVQMPYFISRELIKVNGMPLDNGIVRKTGSSITFRMPTTLNVGSDQWLYITIDEKAEIMNPETTGTYLMYIFTTKDTTATGVSYKIENQDVEALEVTPHYNNDKQIYQYTMLFTTSENGSLLGSYDWISLWLPKFFTQAKFLDNITIKINGYTLSPQNIQVSGQTVTFLLPSQVSIGYKEQVTIILKDENGELIPNNVASFKFQISTSKDSTWKVSNQINVYNSDVIDNGNNNSNQEEGNGNNSTVIGSKANKIQLFVNRLEAYVGGKKTALDTAPQIIEGSTLVPLRFISDSLGGEIDYRADQKRIIILYNNKYLIITIGSKTVYTKDEVFTLPISAKVINGRTLVPLRFISEWMGLDVLWNKADKSITLQK